MIRIIEKNFQSLTISVLWTFIALISVFAPPFVTGGDPTSLPFAALIVPVVGTILTIGVCFLGKLSE